MNDWHPHTHKSELPDSLNMQLLVLQDEKVWKDVTGKEVVPENNSCELYFEERNIEAFTEKLEKLYPESKYVTRLMTYSWGQKVIRFYDLDGNLIEVRTPMRG